jgi:hypothetical protein
MVALASSLVPAPRVEEAHPTWQVVLTRHRPVYARRVRTEARAYPDGSLLLIRLDEYGRRVGSFRLFRDQLAALCEALADHGV